MRDQVRYKAFISYSHKDARYARRIHRFIEGYSVPKYLVGKQSACGPVPQKLRPVFKDREELPTAADLGAAVREAVDASEHLIVICSPMSAKSRWVNEEVLAFKRTGRADRIQCVIVSGEPYASELPGREAEECFCEALRFKLGEDGQLNSVRAEPVAADARHGGDGRYLARLKIIAGLLGVGLDELRQRDLQRRNRRMAAIAAASMAGMAFTLMLAWVASAARDDAERRREQADDLIGFMLGDLRERLNEVGRLDVLDSVTAKALDYFAELPPQDLSEEALANRAEALMQLGQVQMTRGRLADAMTPFQESLIATEELSSRDPGNLDRLFDVGQAHFWVGYVHWETDNLDAADQSLRRYHEISQTLFDAAPENDDYSLELGYSFNNLAVLSDRRGDSKAAQDYNRRMIELSRSILDRDPDNETYRRALGEALSWSGTILRNDNQFVASVKRFGEYLQLAEEASRLDPADTQWIDHRMLANRLLGDSNLDLGHAGIAQGYYQAGIALAQSLIEIEPANEYWQVEHSLFVQRLAQMSIRQGMLEQGLQSIAATRAMVSAHLASNPDNIDWLFVSTELDLIAGKALLALGDLDAANQMARTVSDGARQLVEENPTRVATRALSSRSLIFNAMVAETDPESPLDRDIWEDVLAAISGPGAEPRSPDARDAHIRAALYAGMPDDVAGDIGLLREAGYRHPDFVAVLREHDIEY